MHLAVNWNLCLKCAAACILDGHNAGLVLTLYTLYAGASLILKKPSTQPGINLDRNGELDADELLTQRTPCKRRTINEYGTVCSASLWLKAHAAKANRKSDTVLLTPCPKTAVPFPTAVFCNQHNGEVCSALPHYTVI